MARNCRQSKTKVFTEEEVHLAVSGILDALVEYFLSNNIHARVAEVAIRTYLWTIEQEDIGANPSPEQAYDVVTEFIRKAAKKHNGERDRNQLDRPHV